MDWSRRTGRGSLDWGTGSRRFAVYGCPICSPKEVFTVRCCGDVCTFIVAGVPSRCAHFNCLLRAHFYCPFCKHLNCKICAHLNCLCTLLVDNLYTVNCKPQLSTLCTLLLSAVLLLSSSPFYSQAAFPLCTMSTVQLTVYLCKCKIHVSVSLTV